MVELAKQRCLKSFMNEVTAARCKDDRDSSQSVLAMLMKLIANASFSS